MPTVEEKIATVKETFLGRIDWITTAPMLHVYFNIDFIMHVCYHFARLSRIYPTQFQLSPTEAQNFINNFPIAAKIILLHIYSVYGMKDGDDMNIVKGYRSAVRFFRTDIFNLYKRLTNYHIISLELRETMTKYFFVDFFFSDMLGAWKRNRDGIDEQDDISNLNGVPKKHKWWTKKHRKFWKNKDVFINKVFDIGIPEN